MISGPCAGYGGRDEHFDVTSIEYFSSKLSKKYTDLFPNRIWMKTIFEIIWISIKAFYRMTQHYITWRLSHYHLPLSTEWLTQLSFTWRSFSYRILLSTEWLITLFYLEIIKIIYTFVLYFWISHKRLKTFFLLLFFFCGGISVITEYSLVQSI